MALRRILLWLIALALLATLAAAGAAKWWIDHPLQLAGATVEVSVEPGTPPREVAAAWVRAGVQTDPAWLYQCDARRIRAGSYEVEPGATARSLLDRMVQGDEAMERVRLIEGWTFRQFRAALAAAPHLKPLGQAMADAELMAAIGLPGVAAEGRFFPDTYLYSRGVSDLTVLKRAAALQTRRLAEVWATRADNLPVQTPEQALVLASIVEKETGRAADRGQIAGVFTNRLRIACRCRPTRR